MNEYISKDLGKVVETKEEAKSDDTVNSNVSVISNNLNEQDYVKHMIDKVASERE